MEMDTRAKMTQFREKRGTTLRQMARYCKISEGLLRLVEEGSVTHPRIARRIGEEYELTELETEDLMPVFRRPHGGDYDPDRYKDLRDFNEFEIPRYLKKKEGDVSCSCLPM